MVSKDLNMDKNSNILDELKAQGRPYGVPDGYFESLRARLDAIPSTKQEEEVPMTKVVEMPSLWTKVRPYIAMAAAFLILVTAGTAILKTTTNSITISEDEYMQIASILPVTDPYAIYYEDYADEEEEVSGDDIVNYLIETGVSLEQLAYTTLYEEDY